MMDRLTKWTGLGVIASKYQEDFDMTEETCAEYQKVLDKLAHYEDLEEAGRLIELPCAVGDTVWVVTWVFNGKEIVNSIVSRKIDGFIEIRSNSLCMISIEPYRMDFASSEFGKTIFLTREEAEAALKECETGWTF